MLFQPFVELWNLTGIPQFQSLLEDRMQTKNGAGKEYYQSSCCVRTRRSKYDGKRCELKMKWSSEMVKRKNATRI
jgi:hypothetical protein